MITLLQRKQVPAGSMQPTDLPSGRCLLLPILLADSRPRCLTAAKLLKSACHLLLRKLRSQKLHFHFRPKGENDFYCKAATRASDRPSMAQTCSRSPETEHHNH